jgi:hypothetical protein
MTCSLLRSNTTPLRVKRISSKMSVLLRDLSDLMSLVCLECSGCQAAELASGIGDLRALGAQRVAVARVVCPGRRRQAPPTVATSTQSEGAGRDA